MKVDSVANTGGRRDLLPSLARLMIAEMIKPAIQPPSEGYFSAGTGESQFSSFLLDEYSERVVQKVDIFKGKTDG